MVDAFVVSRRALKGVFMTQSERDHKLKLKPKVICVQKGIF